MQCTYNIYGPNELYIIQYLDQFVIIYLDDILIYRDNEFELVNPLRKVLEILRANKLYAKKIKMYVWRL